MIEYPLPDAIDLGLPSGVKWASINLGASKPEEYGDYFAWGETEPKKYYSFGTYLWGEENSMTRYYEGDNKEDFKDYDYVDDAAHIYLKGKWHTPSKSNFEELIGNCSCEALSLNGVDGYKLTSTVEGYTDKWIFLPISGAIIYSSHYENNCYYWTSSLSEDDYNAAIALCIFSSDDVRISTAMRYAGQPIRPVCPKE